jgi:hypothetical protein
MRAVQHLVAKGYDPRLRMSRKGRHDLFRPRQSLGRWDEGVVDDRDLRGMDRQLGGKSVAPGGFAFRP